MYITPLLLLVPEFAADFCEENEQLFDIICLRKYEYLDDIINEIHGDYEEINFVGGNFSGGCLGLERYINNVVTFNCNSRGFACGSGINRFGSTGGIAFCTDISEFGNGSACTKGFGNNNLGEMWIFGGS